MNPGAKPTVTHAFSLSLSFQGQAVNTDVKGSLIRLQEYNNLRKKEKGHV